MPHGPLTSLALAIGMLGVIALLWGGAKMLRSDRQKGILMLVCALVLFVNILIWTV